MIQAYIRILLASTQAASLFPCQRGVGAAPALWILTRPLTELLAVDTTPGHVLCVLNFQEQCGLIRCECLMPRVGVLDHHRQFWFCHATVDAACTSCEAVPVVALSVPIALHFYLDQAWVGYSMCFTDLTTAPSAGTDSVA